MTTLKRLIKGQDVAFDTHQAGDTQEVHWRELHLEKRMHGGKGKARFPFFDHAKPSSSNRMSEDVLHRVTIEVRRALSNDPDLTQKLGETIVDSLERFSQGTATVDDGKAAAQQLAKIFGLKEEFLRVVEDYAKGRLIALKTLHADPDTKNIQEIYQSKTSVEIRRARRNYSLNNINPYKS